VAADIGILGLDRRDAALDELYRRWFRTAATPQEVAG
jgi:hypothetical protein